MSIPIIYLACGNHFLKRKGKWVKLNYLSEETEEIAGSLKTHEDIVALREGPDTEYAYELLTGGRFLEEVVVFHLSGKLTDQEEISFDSGNGKPHTLTIEKTGMLLKAFPHLGLVVLNGLATESMVSGLLEAGVPAILATTRKNSSETTQRELLQQVYQQISEGKTLLQAVETVLHSPQEASPVTFGSGISVLSLLQEEEEDELPWGIYFRTDRREVIHRQVNVLEPLADPRASESSDQTTFIPHSAKGWSAWQIMLFLVGILTVLILLF